MNGGEEKLRDRALATALRKRALRIHLYALAGGVLFAAWGYMVWSPPPTG